MVTPDDGEADGTHSSRSPAIATLANPWGPCARLAFERQWDKEKALAEWQALLQA
jgi:hypothetical protein